MSLAEDPPPLNTPARQRSTRDRPAKTPLSEAAVVEAALGILQAEGLEAVSMRRVAAALDTGAASLYVYVSGREGLIQAMLDRVMAAVELEAPDPTRWRSQLVSVLTRTLEAFLAHPGIAAATLAEPMMTEPLLALADNLLGLVLAAGASPQDAAWACDVLWMLVTASAIEGEERRARSGGAHGDLRDQVQEMYSTFVQLPADRFPALSAYATEMVTGDGEDRFRFALDVVIDGVVARAARR